DAVLFVWHAMSFAFNRAMRAGRSGGHVSAQELCWCIRDFALEEYDGDPDVARERLAAMGLGRSEDVGEIVFAFVEAKLTKARETDLQSDFDGLFTLATLFDQ